MRAYALTFLTANKDTARQVAGEVKAWLKKAKGELVKEEEWGEKTLAYPIAKKTKACYTHYLIRLEPRRQPELAQALRLNEQVSRFLFVRV